MRVTIDLDTRDWYELVKVLKAGFDFKLGMPKKIEKTRKGYHIVWDGLKLSKDEAIAIRSIIGDDDMRVFFDLMTPPFQVLFRKKRRKKIKVVRYDAERVL